MHASRGRLGNSLVILAALLGSGVVTASPVDRRGGKSFWPNPRWNSSLNPWVSLDTSGKPSTVTPLLTTVSGVATTLNAAPAASTVTTTSADGSAAASITTSSSAPAATTASGSYPVCHNMNGDFAPFCLPVNGDSLLIDNTYYVTWDTSFFKMNETLLIQANYVNASGGGPQAFQSDMRSNSWGHIDWTINSDWLKSLDSNNLTLFITTQGGSIHGPTITVTKPPAVTYSPPPPTQAPKGKDLYIALPAVGGFIILCVCGGFIFNRRNRKIGLGNIMGRRKGYGVGKSRRQRLGLGKKSGAIQLREQELSTDGQYRDLPVEQEARVPAHRRNDSDLGSLVGTPTEERPRGGNVFRDEVRRQEQERF